MRDRARRYLTVLIFILLYWFYLTFQTKIWLDAEITCAINEFCEFYTNIANFWHILIGVALFMVSIQIAGWIEGYWNDDEPEG